MSPARRVIAQTWRANKRRYAGGFPPAAFELVWQRLLPQPGTPTPTQQFAVYLMQQGSSIIPLLEFSPAAVLLLPTRLAARLCSLVFQAEQVEHSLDRIEGQVGDFDEYRVPVGHGAVPQPGQF